MKNQSPPENPVGAVKRAFISPPRDKTVLELLRSGGGFAHSYCGGRGTCGKCRVLLEGELSPVTDAERRMLGEGELAGGIRLACLTYPRGDFNVLETRGADGSDMAIQTGGAAVSFPLSPLGAGETLPARGYGVAADIGTTTVALYLCDLAAGKTVRVAAFRNPQAAYGADVISRVAYITENNALATLRSVLLDEINRAISGFGIEREDLRAAAVCGNTIMQHILFGLDPEGMARAPFMPLSLFGETLSAAEAGFDAIPPGSPIFAAPCFSAYVGGDIAAGLVASGLYTGHGRSGGLELYVDIGTNGEIALVGGGKVSLCSAAAGPAFEGAKIERGMPGTAGAVNRVRSLGQNPDFDVIGSGEAVGICGSGLLDLAALLIDGGIIDESGYMEENYVLSGSVYLTPRDVRELQLAKAAIAAGIMTLLRERGAEPGDVTRVVLAGGFGSALNPASARRIGLIPRGLECDTVSVGNAAGAGAVALLLSGEARRAAAGLGAISRYHELSASAFFMEQYVEQMAFE